MSRLNRFVALAAVAACFAAAPAESPKLVAKEGEVHAKAEEGFKPIFNGKDLTGWVYGTTKTKDGKAGENKAGVGYQIKDGVIYSTKTDGGNLYTEKEYANFVLRFEFKLTENANNGIGIRAPLTGDSAYEGMEIQVLDDSGSMYKTLRPEQYHGSVYDVFAAKRGSQKPVGEWNVEEIRAEGSHITVTVNGQVITDANLDDVKDEAKLKKHPGLKNKAGHIGFLGHGAQVEFRNLLVKELNP